MSNSFEAVIKVSMNAYNRERALLPKKLGNAAESHFKDNWRKQGFDDNTVQAWKPRKNNSDPGRAINVKTGRLRRSWDVIVQSLNRIFVVNDTPYAGYVNKVRKFAGKSHNLDEKSGVLIMRMIKSALK
jgi:hypothetical protein